jgi:hypothetical protein
VHVLVVFVRLIMHGTNIKLKSVEKVQVHCNLTSITSVLHEDQHTFLIISRSFLRRIKNVSGKVVENFKTQIVC